MLPRLAITIGDPAGIGPEIVRKALSERSIYSVCRPVVIGGRRFIDNLPFLERRFPVRFIDVPSAGSVKPGKLSAAAGRAAYSYIMKGVSLVQSGEADALVTAPVSKEAIVRAGMPFTGHTELLASLAKVKTYAMLMVAGDYRSVMVTRHMPVNRLSGALKSRDIVSTALQTAGFLERHAGLRRPKLAVMSLNPHAGEGGLIGREEIRVIRPAVVMLRKKGINVDGPLPPDSAWLKMINGKYDLLVAMYHDQTMIGLKCLAPEKIVNVTAGLPFVRTSPGHGTAFDIAGKGIADARSMIEAITLAASYASN